MEYLNFVKKIVAASTLLTVGSLLAEVPFAITGGFNNSSEAYAVFIPTSSNNASQLSLPGLSGNSEIRCTTINSTGRAFVGGYIDVLTPYGAVIPADSSSGLQVSFTGLASGEISASAMNLDGVIIVGASPGGAAPYAGLISPGSLTASSISLPGVSGTGAISSVAINDAGTGLMGGNDTGGLIAYAAFLPSGSLSATEISLPGLSGNSDIRSVAINKNGQGIVGGNSNTSAYAAIVPAGSSSATQISLSPLGGVIATTTINDAGVAIAGGLSNNLAYVVRVPAGSTSASEITLPGTSAGSQILSASINESGRAIVGGNSDALFPYAAIIPVDSSTASQITLTGFTSSGEIRDCAINRVGQAIVVGVNDSGSEAYAAIIPANSLTAVQISLPNLAGSSGLNKVSILMTLASMASEIPTAGLSGNNLAFANYINENAPTNGFYFIPAIMDGTLSQALQSAAPTRNALAVWSVDQNLFNLNNALSSHAFALRSAWKQPAGSYIAARDPTQLSTSSSSQVQSPSTPNSVEPIDRPYEVWMTVLGSDAFQKKQHQTPAFNPITGAVILGFDGKLSSDLRLGTGVAYAYTHLHEKEGAGHANINQEYLMIYSLWQRSHLYIDAALWGGLFQINNVRNITMTGFEFTSTSHPHGWNLAPHFEMGYTIPFDSNKWGIEPFVMLDWVANWQGSYKERGSGPFNAGQKRTFSSMLRSELSTRFYESFPFTNWTFYLHEKIGFVNKKPFHVGRVNAFLVGAPGSFTVTTLTTTQNLGVGQFEMVFEPHKKQYPRTTLSYQGEFGSMYQSHMGSIELNWSF